MKLDFKDMGPADAAIVATFLINSAFEILEKVGQVYGKEAVTPWEEITDKQAILRARIDAAKERP
jgi:hypothetical protein